MLSALSDPDVIRTHDLLLRRQLLYPAELPDQKLGLNDQLITSQLLQNSLTFQRKRQ